MGACVHVCVCVRARACVCVCVSVCVSVCTRVKYNCQVAVKLTRNQQLYYQ